MTATNHVMTGALIGVVISNPVVAVVTALVSHFVLDALPHYSDDRMTHASRKFLFILFADMCLAVGFISLIVITTPARWPFVILCGVLGSSPDLMWLAPWIQELRGKLDLRKTPSSPDRITSATNSFYSPRLSFRTSCLSDRKARQDLSVILTDRRADRSMYPSGTSPSDKTVFARADSPWERAILRKSSKQPSQFGMVRQFHAKIQWCTKPWGIGIELVWATGVLVLLARYV